MRILTPLLAGAALLALTGCGDNDAADDAAMTGDATQGPASDTTTVVPGPTATETVTVPGATATVGIDRDRDDDRVIIDEDGVRVDVGDRNTRTTVDVGPTPRATVTTRP